MSNHEKKSSSRKYIDIFLMLIMCTAWATDTVTSKEAMKVFPPILLSSTRFFIVALLTLSFCRRIPPHLGILSIISFVLVTLTYGFAEIGIKLNSSTTVASLFIESSTIASVAFAAIFLKEKINGKIIIGLLITFLGVILITLGNSFEITIHGYQLNKSNVLSILALTMTIFSWSVYTTLSTKIEDKIFTIEMIAWPALIGAIQALLISLIFEKNHLIILDNFTIKILVLILYSGICGVILPLSIFHHLAGRYGVIIISISSMFIPFIVAIESFFLFDEKLGIPIVIGGMLTVIGISIVNFSKSIQTIEN